MTAKDIEWLIWLAKADATADGVHIDNMPDPTPPIGGAHTHPGLRRPRRRARILQVN